MAVYKKGCGHCMTNQPNIGIYCQVTDMVWQTTSYPISGTSTPLLLMKPSLNNGDGDII